MSDKETRKHQGRTGEHRALCYCWECRHSYLVAGRDRRRLHRRLRRAAKRAAIQEAERDTTN